MVGKKYIGKATMGIALLNSENDIIVQSYQKLSVLEIRDITNPLLINTLINATITSTYEIAIDDIMIAIPTVAVYSLFSRKTNFYPSMSAVTFSGSKTFTIRFYPVDPLSLDKSSELATLIKISTDDAMMPYWSTPQISSYTLSLTPPNLESLMQMRNVKLTFSTQIQFSEFFGVSQGKSSQDVYIILLTSGIIDINQLLSPNFDPNVVLNLNSSFNASNITAMLSTHYLQTSINFILDDFIALDTAPIVGPASLQAQFDALGPVKLNRLLSFQFDSSTFIDPDGDYLTYTALNLPSWLQFYPTSQNLSEPAQNMTWETI